ncbi:MAG: carbohydrate-binding family 9-like protein [Lentisphaeria bacterium]|nr:carbohydrate-binding family 9-like protein [Lentisphaeria bacterium]
MKHFYLTAAAAAAFIGLSQSGCVTSSGNRPEIVASYTRQPVALDGKLDEAAWQKTPAYFLVHAREQYTSFHPEIRKKFRNGVIEPGKVRLLWDDKYLYIGFEFEDLDIVAEGTQDQNRHYRMGDVAEVFLKPQNKTWYWESYATPRGHKTVFFFLGRGLLGLPSGFPEKPALDGMKVAAFCYGTLNNSQDKDKKWTAEMAIPREEIAKIGEKLDPETPWLIFFGRYNYGIYLPWKENSSFPQQENGDYHIHEDYGMLKMKKTQD